MKNINISKEVLAVIEAIQDKNNPKIEINHILLNNEDLVVTDTRFLAVYNHNEEDIEGNALIINNKAKYPIKMQDTMSINNNLYGLNKDMSNTYPEYKRIIPTDNWNDVDEMDGLRLLYSLCYNNKLIIDFVKYVTLFKKIDKITFNKYRYVDRDQPIAIANDNFMIVIMPIIF